MKKCFIALDIDGILNSRIDHLLMMKLDNNLAMLQLINSYSYEEQQKHFVAIIEKEFTKMWKFAKKTNGHIDLGNYINLSKLLLLNAWIDNMLSKEYEVHVFGISSWFKFNDIYKAKQSNLDLLLNISHDEAKRFFEFNSEVIFEYAENTTGIGEIRYKQFIQYINKNLNQSKMADVDNLDLVMLYLDDIKVNIQFAYQYLKNKIDVNVGKDNLTTHSEVHPIQLFIPNIEGRIGLVKEHLPNIKRN